MRLGAMLTERDCAVTVHQIEKRDSLDPSPFDTVLVLASVHYSRHQSRVAAWLKANAGSLNQRRSAFLSVSLSAGSDDPDILTENARRAREFAAHAGWKPERIELVAGCLQYPEYGFLERLLMKRVARRYGLPLDTSREHEFTDWQALESLAGHFCSPSRG